MLVNPLRLISDRPDFISHLRILIQRSVVLGEDADLLLRLYDGETLSALRKDLQVNALLGRRQLSFTGLISELEQRLYQASAKGGGS